MSHDDDRKIRVTEAVRQHGQLWVTLGYTYVGAEYNHDDELLMDEAEARTLMDELAQALAHDRMPSAESALVTAECEHDWQYLEREPGEIYTGYCERCTKCGEIVQIPQ